MNKIGIIKRLESLEARTVARKRIIQRLIHVDGTIDQDEKADPNDPDIEFFDIHLVCVPHSRPEMYDPVVGCNECPDREVCKVRVQNS